MSNTSHTWEQYEKENKRNGAIVSALIHAVVIALFFFLGLSSEFPPPVEGILINFGTSESGKGETPPEVVEPVKEIAATPSEPTPAVEQPVEQKIATQDVVEAPAVKKPEKPKEEVKKPVKEEVKKPVPVKEEPKKPVKEEPKVDQTSMYSGAPTGNDNPGDEGITYGPGDQGDPEGDIKSNNYYGDNTGLGNVGVGHDLAGRSLRSIPPINEDYTETGKIAVSIKVDRSGKVLFAKYTQKGSTSTNQKLIRLAEEAAMQAKFSPNSQVAEEQFGTITFTFKLK